MTKLFPFLLAGILLIFPGGLPAQTVVSAQGLQEDFALLKKAYEQLHPGLYRYNTRTSLDRRFAELEHALAGDQSLPHVYLAISRFLATIRCGHTYANFWNQSDAVKRELFRGADKVPFTFRLIDQRMLVVRNASDDARLKPGTEIVSLNGVPVKRLLEGLLPLVKGDGNSNAKRQSDLQVTGDGEFEAFDIYYPLLFPPANSTIRIEARDLQTGQRFVVLSRILTREARRERLRMRYGDVSSANGDLWQFRLLDKSTAYLRLGTFATWTMQLDWRKFLEDAFAETAQKHLPHLIVDIRGNEGGADEVVEELLKYLVWKPARAEPAQERVRYVKVSSELRPYLTTWDKSFYDFEGAVRPLGGGFYTWKDGEAANKVWGSSPVACRGHIYLLTDAANSSATFNLAWFCKRNGLATLVGQPTGGNRRGLNGGKILFLHLPHSGIEADIPVVGVYPLAKQPDAGVLPDIYVRPRVEDIVSGRDTELECVRQRIAENR